MNFELTASQTRTAKIRDRKKRWPAHGTSAVQARGCTQGPTGRQAFWLTPNRRETREGKTLKCVMTRGYKRNRRTRIRRIIRRTSHRQPQFPTLGNPATEPVRGPSYSGRSRVSPTSVLVPPATEKNIWRELI